MKKFLSSCLVCTIILFLFFFMTQRYKVIESVSELASNFEGSSSESNRKEYVEKVRDALISGQPTLEVNYYGSDEKLENFVTSAVDDAFLMDDESTTDDFDYLKYKYKGMHIDMRGLGAAYRVTYQFSYLETNEQTDLLDQRIYEVFQELNIEEKSDYNKIKLIHDFIIQNCIYDISTNQNTAYDCLVEGISACQGYAALTYKMMEEAGIPCRIISGSGLEEPHAWNIVKLDGLWYNIDCTWDDPVGAVGKDYIGYDFFLKNNSDFSDHIKDAEYNTDEFNQEHVMAEISYTTE